MDLLKEITVCTVVNHFHPWEWKYQSSTLKEAKMCQLIKLICKSCKAEVDLWYL